MKVGVIRSEREHLAVVLPVAECDNAHAARLEHSVDLCKDSLRLHAQHIHFANLRDQQAAAMQANRNPTASQVAKSLRTC